MDIYRIWFGLTKTEGEIFNMFVGCEEEIRMLLDDAERVCREEPSVRSKPPAERLHEFFQIMVEAFSEGDPKYRGRINLVRAMAAYLTVALHGRIGGELLNGSRVSEAAAGKGDQNHG